MIIRAVSSGLVCISGLCDLWDAGQTEIDVQSFELIAFGCLQFVLLVFLVFKCNATLKMEGVPSVKSVLWVMPVCSLSQ